MQMDLSLALSQIFPITWSLLSDSEKKNVFEEFSASWGIEDLHFFPMLLRQMRLGDQVIEAAHYEFLKFWTPQLEVSLKTSTIPYVLNPTLQFVSLNAAAGLFGKDPGLYLLWKWNEQLREMMLFKDQAALLDRLQEDQILLRTELSSKQNEILDQLLTLRIVLENISQIGLNS
jgi:hypothetical protein